MMWNSKLSFDAGYQFLEVFAGKGRVSQKMHLGLYLTCVNDNCYKFDINAPKRYIYDNHMIDIILLRHSRGYHVASIDFDYSEKHMDFLAVSGFL